jgi:membrane protease YdiL (CAAX protease family)
MNKHPWLREPELPRLEAMLGLVYLPFHVLGLPQLLNALATAHPGLTTAWANGILYGLATVFVALAFGKRLYVHYGIWVDSAGGVLISLGKSFLLFIGLTVVLSVFLSVLPVENMINPNNQALLSLTGVDLRVTKALAIFLAPIVEEVLFRGVVFGSLRGKNPVAAYVVTFLVFAGAHLWPYLGQIPNLPLYFLQYLPITMALCYSYEATGCLWTPILFHMMNNMMGYNMLQ